MKRFHYSVVRNGEDCEGIIRSESIDSARQKLEEEGCEYITLTILSSLDVDVDAEGFTGDDAAPASSPQ